jgi:hypothetical protein
MGCLAISAGTGYIVRLKHWQGSRGSAALLIFPACQFAGGLIYLNAPIITIEALCKGIGVAGL